MEMSKPSRRHRQMLWCGEVNRWVAVEFVQEGRWPFRRERAIVSCSAFERPGLMNCRRAFSSSFNLGSWDPFMGATSRKP